MSNRDEPEASAGSAEDAHLARLYEALLRVLEGDDIDELAAALGQTPDSASPAPERHLRPGKK
jgi:hypothetical protein